MIFLIPARAGSKRLPGKNKRLFCGLPLWMWSYAQAKRLAGDHDIVEVSSDDPDISSVFGFAPRPAALAQDDTPTSALIKRYQDLLPDHHICLLQPTSPTRSDSLVRRLINYGVSCRSVTNGAPNGQCYVYRRGDPVDVETEKGHDIDTIDDFKEAEKDMRQRLLC